MKEYVSIRHIEELAKQSLNVNWTLTTICNFNCSYCPERFHDGKIRGFSVAEINAMVDQIADHYGAPEKKIFFEFTGGEVSYYKGFLEIAQHIKSKGSDVGIISNGKRERGFWHRLRPLIDHICLSYHPENDYADHFIEIAKYLNQTVTTHVNVMMLPQLFDHCMELANRIAGVPELSIGLQAIYEGMNGKKYDYTEDQLKALEKQYDALHPVADTGDAPSLSKQHKVYRGDMHFKTHDGEEDTYSTPEILANDLNHWKGWICYAGVENLRIGSLGNVFRCGDSQTYLGNLKTGLRFPTNPTLCQAEKCYCGFDMMSTKFRPPRKWPKPLKRQRK